MNPDWKTGQCYWRDEDFNLWLAETFQNPETGETVTTQTPVSED